MKGISSHRLQAAILLLAQQDKSQEAIESEVTRLLDDSALARRAIDWIPEAFGAILIGHMNVNVELPKTFHAKDRRGVWKTFPFSAEPIFTQALQVASFMYHNGPRDVFAPLATSGSMFAVVNTALNAGKELSGAALSGPALIGIPAETYSVSRSWWRQLVFGGAA